MDKVTLTGFCCKLLGVSEENSNLLDESIRNKDFLGALKIVKGLKLNGDEEEKLIRCVNSYRYCC